MDSLEKTKTSTDLEMYLYSSFKVKCTVSFLVEDFNDVEIIIRVDKNRQINKFINIKNNTFCGYGFNKIIEIDIPKFSSALSFTKPAYIKMYDIVFDAGAFNFLFDLEKLKF